MNCWLRARVLLVLGAACLLGFSGAGGAQEEKETPSQKTREAVEKFKKAPAAVGERLEELKEAGKAKLQATLAPKAQAKKEGESSTSLPKASEPAPTSRYSSAGKRDPFRPLASKGKGAAARSRENLSPLERYELGQLKLVAIIWDIKDPRAMVEDSVGLGYIVKVGTPIGPDEGKIKAIKPGEIVIEEFYTDFFGARKSREVAMNLPAE